MIKTILFSELEIQSTIADCLKRLKYYTTQYREFTASDDWVLCYDAFDRYNKSCDEYQYIIRDIDEIPMEKVKTEIIPDLESKLCLAKLQLLEL